jgi:2-oxoglutarate ferredoxin oxidoreductase subunit beta
MNLTKSDFVTDQEVRWCPGCGDYAILSAMQRTFPELGIPRENIVFISGIGCSGRFPYYMNTYGFHTIHGRAPAVASGLKLVRPDLSVWVITGDGDGLSIGGNHLLHMLRRNFDIKVILFNNQIYGLTKGQYSPTSEVGKITTTTPGGSIDSPINPIAFALMAGATFVARVLDIDAKNLSTLIKKAASHKGSAFIEIYQNCNIFNDGAFAHLSDKSKRDQNTTFFEKGCESLSEAFERSQMVHPVPMGIFREVEKPVYETQVNDKNSKGKVEKLASSEILNRILHFGHTWNVP